MTKDRYTVLAPFVHHGVQQHPGGELEMTWEESRYPRKLGKVKRLPPPAPVPFPSSPDPEPVKDAPARQRKPKQKK